MRKPKTVSGMKVEARLYQKEVEPTFSQSFNLPTTANVLQPMTNMLHNFAASTSARSNHLAAASRKLNVETVAVTGAVACSVVHAPVNTTFGAARRCFDKYQGDSPSPFERVLYSRSGAGFFMGFVSRLQGI
jgi:hypothetical protein